VDYSHHHQRIFAARRDEDSVTVRVKELGDDVADHLLVVDAAGTYRGMLSVTDMVTVIASDEKARADNLPAS